MNKTFSLPCGTLGILFVALPLVADAIAHAERLPSNGDFEYGDGGWNLWIAPDGGGAAVGKAGVPGIGFGESQGSEVVVTQQAREVWQIQWQAPQWLADSGMLYELRFHAKGEGDVPVSIIGGPPDWRTKEMFGFRLDTSWREFRGVFMADEKGFGKQRINFYLGRALGTFRFDDVEVVPLGSANEDWIRSAPERIDSIRKVGFHLRIQDSSGMAVSGADLQWNLVRHEFPFGTALALQGNADSSEQWYRRTAAELFWRGVSENQFKWPDYEPRRGSPARDAFGLYLDFARANGWDMRGHALVWGIQKFGFDKHWATRGSCPDVEKNIKARIERDLAEYRGRIVEYDVWNEPIHEPAIFERCGWQLMDSAFVWAHRADPGARLFINEYDVVAGGLTDAYYYLIRGMLDRGIPVSGIGVQGHWGLRPVVPELVHQRLDRLAELGLPIEVTEIDFGDWQQGLGMSEEEQAKRMGLALRSFYSHPAVDGILLWGFWDNRHWIQDGGIFDRNGRAKPAVDTIRNLWHKEWTTVGGIQTDSTGSTEFRGFPGLYRISIYRDGRTVFRDVPLDRRTPEAVLIF